MSLGRHFGYPNLGPDSSGYRDQGVQGGSLSGPQSRSGVGVEGEEEELGRHVEGFSVEKNDEYTGAQEKDSCDSGSQALKISTTSTSEKFMSPYGDYDMDDSSFFAHTMRLSIVGPNASSARILRRRSSSLERLLITCGERKMVTTAATSFQHTDRSHSLSTKPALVPEKKITSPTESYMKLSLQSSLPLENPTTSRKLLVLDLNGTLLLRGAHSGRRGPPPPARHSADTTTPSSVPHHPYPALRTIYPRPYISSFRAYLFHPTTLQWLDTMVWSSAQPHSVNDMVDKCFGSYKKNLKAVWARDTLGLSGDEYNKKTQTIKDLAKPWAQIPSLISNPYHTQSLPQLLSASHPPDNPSCKVEADIDNHTSLLQQQRQHSALTTILIDDSPLKAVLQPWNHLCVSEYRTARRKLDVEIAERDLGRMWLAERERAKEIEAAATAEEDEVEVEEKRTRDGGGEGAMDATMMKSSEENDIEDNKEMERRRNKRKEKKMLKKEKLLLAKEQQLQHLEVQGKEGIGRRRVEEDSYDEMLLAVIGILDELKHEGSVAGWMRSGGLIHFDGDDQQEAIIESNAIDGSTALPSSENAEAEAVVLTTTTTGTTTTIPMPNPPTTITPISPLNTTTKRDSSSMSIRSPSSSKRRRLTNSSSSDTEMDPVSTTTGEQQQQRALKLGDSDSEMMVPITPMRTTTKNSSSMSLPPSLSLLSPPLPSSPLLSSAQVEQISTGVPLLSSTSTSAAPSTSITSGNKDNSPSPSPLPTQPLLWYETPCVLSHWVQKGRKALTELGIEIVSGVVVPPS